MDKWGQGQGTTGQMITDVDWPQNLINTLLNYIVAIFISTFHTTLCHFCFDFYPNDSHMLAFEPFNGL